MLLGIILDIYSQEYEEYHKNEKCFFSIGKKYEITYEFFLLNYRIDFNYPLQLMRKERKYLFIHFHIFYL